MEFVSIHGTRIPALGLGTYKLRGERCVHIVQEALELGYRHIDTAEMYGNHAEIGQAIAASSVDRDDVFLTTKVWRTNLAYRQVLQAVDESLEVLGVDYIDLLLIHWPSHRVPISDTIRAMNELQRDEKVRLIGVSNFSVDQLEDAQDASATPIVTNQVEYHPFNHQDELLSYSFDNDVMLTAYSPLAEGRITTDETLETIGDSYDKTAAQVSLRWLIQQPHVSAIPKAATRDHLYENFDVFDFTLSTEEMEEIFDLRGGVLSGIRSKLGL